MNKQQSKQLQAGISAFVMIMFGMIAICYLMGFTSAWEQYTAQPMMMGNAGDADITQPSAVDETLTHRMMDGIMGIFKGLGDSVSDNPIVAIIGSIVAIGSVALLLKFGAGHVLAFIVPIVFVILFANIFIFPIAPIADQMTTLPGNIPVDGFLMAFFNLFLVLSIIEFVRGGST